MIIIIIITYNNIKYNSDAAKFIPHRHKLFLRDPFHYYLYTNTEFSHMISCSQVCLLNVCIHFFLPASLL